MASLPAYDLSGLRILIVERSHAMRVLLRQILNVWGIRNVVDVEDGAAALKELRTRVPDIVMTGYMMTPIDGIEFVRMVRTSPDSPSPLIPILMVTAYSEDHRVRDARDAGINEFLAKPVSARSVYLRLVEMIERPRPFIRARNYVGPCRHRRDGADYKGPKRRVDDQPEDAPPPAGRQSDRPAELLQVG